MIDVSGMSVLAVYQQRKECCGESKFLPQRAASL
jgi:hypothetical protein